MKSSKMHVKFNPHGTEVIYYEDGKIQYERVYENGIKVKETSYDIYGKIVKS